MWSLIEFDYNNVFVLLLFLRISTRRCATSRKSHNSNCRKITMAKCIMLQFRSWTLTAIHRSVRSRWICCSSLQKKSNREPVHRIRRLPADRLTFTWLFPLVSSSLWLWVQVWCCCWYVTVAFNAHSPRLLRPTSIPGIYSYSIETS